MPSLPGDDVRPASVRTNGRAHIQDNLWSAANSQYAVWIHDDGVLVSTRKRGRSWHRFDLGGLADNPLDLPTDADPHNTFVVGVDARGHVHVAGNAHSSPLRAIRSVEPGAIDEWEVEDPTSGSDQVTYPRFVAPPNGDLLFFWREGVAGDGRTRMSVLSPAGRWSAPQTILEGRSTGESPYLHHIATDPRTGALHLLFEWRGGLDASTTNDVGYIRSENGGRTWERSDGRRATLPVTHETGELVVDTAPVGSGLLNQGGLAVDHDGRPHGAIVFDAGHGRREVVHVWHDGARWRRRRLPDPPRHGRPAVAATPDGSVWLLSAETGQVDVRRLHPSGDPRRVKVPVPAGWEVVYDTQAMVRLGRIEMLVPHGGDPEVVAVDLPQNEG